MTNETTVLQISKPPVDRVRLIAGFITGIFAVILFYSIIFSPVIMKSDFKYPSVMLALTLLTGTGCILLEESTVNHLPVRMMQTLFISCTLMFLGAVTWWMVIVS